MDYLIILVFFSFINQFYKINSVKANRDQLNEIFLENVYENINERGLSMEISSAIKYNLDNHFSDFLNNFQFYGRKISRNGKKNRKKRLINNLVHVNHDNGVYLLDGFKEIASIPIDFPKDLCLFQVNDTLFAAGLMQNQTDEKIYLQFFKQKHDIFVLIDQYQTNLATDVDCVTRQNKGYVAIMNIITNETDIDPLSGSPIFEITETSIKIVQRMRSKNLKSIRLWTYGNDLYLMKAFNAEKSMLNTNDLVEKQLCFVYKWMGFHFDIIDELPCYHPKHIEPFVIGTDIYVAIANYMDYYGSTDTFSYIYKFDIDTDKFNLTQKLKSKGAIDIKYFHIETDSNHDEHFLIIANSVDVTYDHADERSYETQSAIYKFIHGLFIPSQQLQFYKIQKFLPVVGKDNKFCLLVSCENQEVQVYQYDGWKFTKSISYSTGDVFGKGIRNMRSIIVNDTNLIIIANENLSSDYNNIFSPMYTFKNDLNLLQQEVLEWCDASYKMIDNYDIEKYLRIIEKLPAEDDVLKFTKGIEFRNATVKNINTKTLTTPTAKLGSEFFNNVTRIHKKTNFLETKLRNFTKLKEGAQLGIANEHLNETIASTDELVLDDLSKIEKLNGFSANALLQTTNEMKLNNLVLQNYAYARRGLTVQNKIDSIKFNTSNVLLKHGPQVFNGLLRIKNLFVDKLQTKLINNFTIANPPNPESFEQALNSTTLVVKKLTVHGFINGWNPQFLYENSLKVNEDQVITESYLIGFFSGSNLVCKNLISNKNVSDLIPINHGSFKIHQDIQFADSIEINNLFVTQRINNIKVINSKLDVLLIDSNEKQVIYGDKIFENVKLLEPILLHGKINSKNFENINPIVTVDDSFYLEGDYFISGDVTIRKVLRSIDVFGQSHMQGLKHLQTEGLLLNSTSSNLKFNFTQAVRINNLNAELINGRYHPNDFIKLDYNEMQVITGSIVIRNDLYIDGLCEVDTVNNINIASLNSSILRRTGDQFIGGTIHIEEIIVDNCESHVVTVGTDYKLDDYLYFPDTSKPHYIPFEIAMDSQLNITDTLIINHFTTNSKINGFDFDKMMQDTAQLYQPITVSGDKYFENHLIIENLVSKGTVFGMHLNEMENSFDDSQEIVYDGNAIFTGGQIQIQKIIVHGYINELDSNKFGGNWLLAEYDQNISAEISVDELVFQNDVVLMGKLNKHDLHHIINNCLMIDREEYIENIIFNNGIISLNNSEIEGFIDSIKASDIILSESATIQTITNGLFMEGVLQVENVIYIDNTLNNLAIKNIKAFISPKEFNNLSEGIVINGSCTFPSEPTIVFLNDHSIDQLYHYSWMVNEGKIIGFPVTFDNVEIHGDISLHGLLNGQNLTILVGNYFSLNHTQHITSQIVIDGSAVTSSTVNLADLMLDGDIFTETSEKGVNINHYDKYALKFDTEQTITGEWIMDAVHLFGNLSLTYFDELPDCLINGLVSTDIVFEEKTMINVSSRKSFQYINSYSIACTFPCTLQDINVIDWINDAVDKDTFNIIEGSLTIDNVHIDALYTDASIGNINFHSDNMIMKTTNQTINGTVTITSEQEKYMSIDNLYASNINEIPLNFLNNIAINTENPLSIRNKIVFVEPITIENNLNVDGNIFGVDASELSTSNQHFLDDIYKLKTQLVLCHEIANQLETSYYNQAYYVQHFIHRQTIIGEIVKIISISLVYNQNGDKRNYVAILEIQENVPVVNFYRYSAGNKAIIRDININPISFNDSKIIDITLIHFTNIEMLYIESTYNKTIEHSMLSHSLKGFQKAHQFYDDIHQKLVAFTLSNRDCLLFYSVHTYPSISCVNNKEGRLDFYQNLEKVRIKQALPIQNNIYISLALLTIDNRVEMWIEDANQKLVLHQIIDVSDPISLTGVSFETFNYVAIASTSLNGSINFGSIEIYRAPQNGTFYHFQTINIKVPKSIEFSVVQNRDLHLYAITDDPISPLIIYEYAGIMGFRSKAHGAWLPIGDELILHKDHKMKKDFVIIKSSKRALIVEVVMNKKFD